MRIKTTCRPISREYTSMVDLVRRRNPPPYSRSSKWANWTEAGGVTWTFVWLRIATLLICFGMVVGGFAPGSPRGVPYDLSEPKLTWSDVRHLRLGGAITDLTGQLLIDPGTDDIVFVTVDSSGLVATQVRPHSKRAEQSIRTVAILQPSRDATYASVVGALDMVLQKEVPVDAIWISAPGDFGTSD